MAGVYHPRHPDLPAASLRFATQTGRTVLYRVLFHYKEYGFLRPVVKEVVERYLDCGNPRCGFARIRCPDCGRSGS